MRSRKGQQVRFRERQEQGQSRQKGPSGFEFQEEDHAEKKQKADLPDHQTAEHGSKHVAHQPELRTERLRWPKVFQQKSMVKSSDPTG